MRGGMGRGMRCARGRGMHQMFFTLRRGFHKSNQFLSRMLQPFGITPARLDVLHAIDDLGVRPRQTWLAQWFGVTAATMSKLVRALEGLGLVARARDPADARAFRISLTELGLRLLRRVRREIQGSGAAELAAVSAVTWTWWDDTQAFIQMEAFDDALSRIRRQFGDIAAFHYPWHPDDFWRG